jgi:hypothetical protein
MGAGAIAAVAAAGAAQRDVERTLECFRVADATAPDRARSLDQLGLVGGRGVNHLFAAGVILPGPTAGTVYLSEVAYAAFRRRRQRGPMLAAVLGACALILAGIMMFAIARRNASIPPH